MLSQLVATAALAAGCALAGCGGGGGSGGGSSGGPSSAQLVPSPASVAVTAWVTDSSPQFTIRYDTLGDSLLTFHPAGAMLGTPAATSVDLNGDRVGWSRIHFDQGKLLESHGTLYDVGSRSGTSAVVVAPPDD